MTGRSPSPRVLRVTLIAGVILFALIVIVLSAFYFIGLSGTRLQKLEDNFSRALREYDLYASFVPGFEKDYDKLSRDLDRLEKTAISYESWLSVLKRRRILARENPAYAANYNKSLDSALIKYPNASSITALACERLIKDIAITPGAEDIIRSYLPSFIGIDYNNFLLSLHVLLGDFRNPERAKIMPEYLLTDGTETVTVNLILLKMLRGDITGAYQDAYNIYLTKDGSLETRRFAAEFFYDFGDLEKSAEIFTLINDDKALSRASDALYLAGYTGSAKYIWRLLAETNSLARSRGDTENAENYIEKSLYNLGTASEDADESASYFRKLLDNNFENVSDFKQFGLIRYSRLLDLEEAMDALNKTRGLSPTGYPYIDLEICKRLAVQWELKRQMAEAWFLIDRHPEDEDLYRWVSRQFLFQRNYEELEILLDRADYLKFEASNKNGFWPAIAKAINFMALGELDKAEKLFKEIPEEQADWTVFANLGRILEAEKKYAPAVGQYEAAFIKLVSGGNYAKTAARIQIRMAKCYNALNLAREARHALETALEIDPGNSAARMELDRMIMTLDY